MAGAARSPQVSAEVVREELGRVLASAEFRTSKRSQEFLKYVVEHTLNGRTELLKERIIGIEVFGRSTNYDPGEDATVRVKAGEVRKRLGLYYSEQGALDPVRIELPLGAYVPEFHAVEAPPVAPESLAPPQASPETRAQRRGAPEREVPPAPLAKTRGHLWIGLAALVCFLAAGLTWLRTRPANTALDQFWGPVLTGDAPLLLSAAFVPVYGLDSDAHPKPRAEDFVLLNDQFVGGGDLIAISRLSSMLTRRDRPYRLKVGNDVSFQDLRTGPAILVGYSYTRWREVSREMRFFIDGARRPIGITDGGAPTAWSLPNLPANRHTEEDYAIVSRVFHPDTRAMLVEVAGITQYGTDAAADLVTNPELMTEALRGAPPGWQRKNLQLVVHVKVISGSPSSPKVVATHFW
jgi:hypothetical protein